jgi:hypothetical protein
MKTEGVKAYFKELGYSRKSIKNDIKEFFIESAFVIAIGIIFYIVKTF